VHVTEGVLKRAVLEIRKALADPVDQPCFIQTLHRRGYRFLVPVVRESASRACAPDQPGIVGRERELLQLDGWVNEALAGSRQIVFITGEAGLGKTAFIDQFAHRLPPNRVSMARGHCLPQFCGGEPFLPVFEALDQLRRTMGRRLTEVLRLHAPSWLAQMPALIESDEERMKLQAGVLCASPERMAREMAAALEALSLEAPLVLVLEDLHWSDPATINLLSAIGVRSCAARLMILATYRPAESGAPGSLLRVARNEMELHKQCQVVALGSLSEQDTADYLAARFPDMTTSVLAPALHQRSSGNPLLMVCLAAELRQTGTPDRLRTLVPDALQQMFEGQADQCSAPERELLAAAAVAGGTFSVAIIASALGWTADEAELHCEVLVRQRAILKHCLAPCSDFLHYSFVHSLCRDALYRRIPAGRRVRLQTRLTQSEHKGPIPGNVSQAIATALFEQQSYASFA
jgi:predicted ATPase